jgi:hypothetical protein
MNASENNPVFQGRNWATVLVAVGACLIFAALVWQMKKYTQTTAAVDEARKAERSKALGELRAVESDALKNLGWVDQPKGIVRLPIAEAMKLAEREWQNPAQARSNLIARVEKATAAPPKEPEKPSQFE